MTESEERAKDWLNRNFGMSLEIAAIKRRLERMESNIEKVCKPIRLKEVQEGHGDGNSQENLMAEYLDLAAEIERRELVLEQRDKETATVIDKVESPILRTILIERYINRLIWRDICEAIHLEKSRMLELHLQALSAVVPYIPERR